MSAVRTPHIENHKFGYRSTALEVAAGHDLTGKVAIVTGASSGIGVETARALAKQGAHTILAVRDTTRGQTVADDIIKTTGNSKVDVMKLDLESFAGVRAFVDAWKARGIEKLHLLINNAGIMATPYGKTVDGYEQQFAVNHLAHFLLTLSLLPYLKACGGGARVVNVSSCAHVNGGMRWDDINFEKDGAYNKWIAYAQSKSANILFTKEFNKRYASEGVIANAVHPGGIDTGLQKHMPREEKLALGWIDENGKVNDLFKTTEQGASTTIWAALAPECGVRGGDYCENCNFPQYVAGSPEAPRYQGVAPHVENEEDARKLWDFSIKAVGL